MAGDGTAPAHSRPGLLIVEDDVRVVYVLSSILADLDCEVTGVARSAESAYRCAATHRPDLALMDIGLDGPVDGVEAAHVLQARYGVPSLFVTATEDDAILDRAKAAAPLGYLVKPFLPQQLESALSAAYRALRSRPGYPHQERCALAGGYRPSDRRETPMGPRPFP